VQLLQSLPDRFIIHRVASLLYQSEVTISRCSFFVKKKKNLLAYSFLMCYYVGDMQKAEIGLPCTDNATYSESGMV